MESTLPQPAAGKPRPGGMDFSRTEGATLLIRLLGNWRLGEGIPAVTEVERALADGAPVRRIAFDAGELSAWDSGLLIFLRRVMEQAHRSQIEIERSGLPEGVRKLLGLAAAVPPRGTHADTEPPAFVARIGQRALDIAEDAGELVGFVGDATLAFVRLLGGKARYRRSDLAAIIQEVGPRALSIVTLISLLVGLIMAFVGAVQLERFGAQIYVADLVGLAMSREMGAMMTAIIMAGRTGAAFAAQLGTMEVNEEIDAYRTLGIPPMEFLVLPRMLALILMMPLLTLYADLVGILGGAIVGVGILDLGVLEYFFETRSALGLLDFGTGLLKSVVFGALVAIAGCLRGMQCGRSSAAVGVAATSAVVTGIVLIIVADALFTIFFNALGI
jgi:phospholipid/cholesterol/gamma-HCH transport system permease protein